MSHTPKAPAWGMLQRAVLATAGATCLLLAFAAPAAAVDWSQSLPTPLPTNEFGASTRLDVFEDGPVRLTNDGTRIAPNPNPTEPSTGTGVFEPFYTVHRSTGSCSSGARCIDYTVGSDAVSDVKVEGGFNTGAPSNDVNYEMGRGSSDWTRSVTMGEFNINPGSSGYIELQFDVNETGSGESDPNKIVVSELQIFIGSNLDNPEASNISPDTGYTGGTFDTDASASPNQLLGLNPVWSLDSTENGNVDILLQASICENQGQCGSGNGDMSIFIPIAQLGNFNPGDNFVLYTENLFVDDGFTEVRFNTARVVPEPGTLALLGIGVIGLGYVRRRRTSRTACEGERFPA